MKTSEDMYRRWLLECVFVRGWSTFKCAKEIGADDAAVLADFTSYCRRRTYSTGFFVNGGYETCVHFDDGTVEKLIHPTFTDASKYFQSLGNSVRGAP